MHEQLARSSGAGGLLLLLLVLGTIARFAVWIGLAAAAIAALVVLWKLTGVLDRWLERREKRRERKQLELAEVARRADEQNQQVLAGDPRGIYGEYRPHEDFSPVATDPRVEGM